MTYANILIVDDEELARDNIEANVLKVMPSALIYKAGSAEEAIRITKQSEIDIAMLDIEMPGMRGLELAKKLKDIRKYINIIFVTAYANYAVEAMRERASGYLLKPATAEAIREEFDNLRNPIEATQKKLYIQCFGKFEVYSEGEPVIFNRAAEKEVLAYLIDLKGDGANTEELCGILWSDPDVRERRRDYFRVLISSLKKTLAKYGAEDILVKKRNYFAVNTAMVDCDYYNYLRGDVDAVNRYHGDYMSQYSWADMSVAKLING